jgi:hypothetical protein
MKSKTAVEWFAGEIKGGKLITNQKFEELLQQAKEKEVNAIDNIIESFIDEFKSKIAPTMGVLIELDRLKDKYTNKEII